MGSWGWTEEEGEGRSGEGEAEEPGGLTLDGEERFVVVEPGEKGGGGGGTDGEGRWEGRWEVRWDKGDDLLKGVEGVEGRKVLRVSLERTFVEEPKGQGKGGEKTGEKDKEKKL